MLLCGWSRPPKRNRSTHVSNTVRGSTIKSYPLSVCVRRSPRTGIVIEFTFRDAKQHFGLEDFMGVGETSTAFMGILARPLIWKGRRKSGRLGVTLTGTRAEWRIFVRQHWRRY